MNDRTSHTADPDAYDYTLHYAKWEPADEEQRSRQIDALRDELRPLLPQPAAQTRVLDVGCGTGAVMSALLRYGFQDVSGIDVDKGQVAATVAKGLRAERTTDTAAYLRERPGRYDVVVLRDVLEHVPPAFQIELCRAIGVALSPGGRLVVQVPNANNPVGMRWRYIDFTHHSSFTEHSLHFVLANAGFERISIPASPPLGLIPLAFWKGGYPGRLRRWLVRFCWKQVLAAELGGDAFVKDLCLELNMRAVAFKPGGAPGAR
jgi:2-polyprenyl-3-methyl-5-hydroxy-6-metoxy-1,4-benzoquinol methylase